ncbi:MAG: ATP-binding protein [Planctomycetes bacterium]|nr:ATP-binding protein [Planctomycetota bacterium]
MATKLKPWYQVVTPREDLRENRPLDASEFAVHLDHVRDRTAPEDYIKPDRFFQRTYLTKSLLDLSSQVIRRLSGVKVETSAVFNMATQFGGGKTHSLTALYHLANNGSVARGWQGVDSILVRAQIAEVPKAAVAVFVGTEFDVLEGRGNKGEPKRATPWGEIAWQLGGAKAFEIFSKHDAEGIAPGGDVISQMLEAACGEKGAALILMDELMNYVSGARKRSSGGEMLRFLQNLTGVAAAADRVVVCVSIPSSSETELPDAQDRADYEAFKKMLDRVGKAISMSNEGEVNEIIRRRLFEWTGLPEDGRKAAAEHAEWAKEHAAELANMNGENIPDLFRNSYPFHPSVISVFERKWQSLARFQRTRGILRLLALWVSKSYAEGYGKATGDPLIQLGSAPLFDPTFCDSVFEQLGEDKLKVPVATDIAGKNDSHAIRLDNEASAEVKKARLHQKVATAIFFESNGGQSQTKADATVPEIKTALGGPDLNLADIDPVLEALASSCYYLVWDKNKYRFGLKPNLNQMLVQCRGNVKPKDVDARIKQEIEVLFKEGAKGIDRKYVPQRSNDVPDRPQLTLVVMGVETPVSDPGTNKLVEEIVRSSGTSGRTFKSGLVFAVPESATGALEAARNVLAWEDIESDDDARARLDEPQIASLKKSLERAKRDLREALFRSYRHLLLLGKDNKLKPLDLGQITSSSVNGGIADLILRELEKLDEAVPVVGVGKLVKYWPPAFTEWSLKDVRDAFFASPALPRLLNPDSIKRTVADGVVQGALGYAHRKGGGGLSLVKRPGESLSEQEVEISDEACILRAEDARKLIEPPRLERLVIEPARVEIKPGENAAFTIRGVDQYGQAIAVPAATWSASGGQIDSAGKFTAGKELGVFWVQAASNGVEGKAAAQIVAQPSKSALGGGGASGAQTRIRWSGTVPPQKWMNFYTKVVGKFANTPGLTISVSFDVPSEGEQSKAKADEARSALKELGLDDDGLGVS